MAADTSLNKESANAYLDEIVLPTIVDFESNPTSRRHAFLAALVVYHTIDYMYAHENTRHNCRRAFGEASPVFGLIDRVAHAFKHVQTGNPNEQKSQPLHVGDVITRPPAYWGIGHWDVSRWDDPIGGVTLKQNVEIDLLAALKAAVTFLRTKIG